MEPWCADCPKRTALIELPRLPRGQLGLVPAIRGYLCQVGVAHMLRGRDSWLVRPSHRRGKDQDGDPGTAGQARRAAVRYGIATLAGAYGSPSRQLPKPRVKGGEVLFREAA